LNIGKHFALPKTGPAVKPLEGYLQSKRPYSRPMPRVLRRSWGGARFLVDAVPLSGVLCSKD
jgi:hypothetical protein